MPAIRKTSESITKSSGTDLTAQFKDASKTDTETVSGQSPVGCIIMASGLGNRFGGNKLLADFCGRPMISYILDATAGFPRLSRLVVTRHEEIASLCREKGVEVLCHNLTHRNDTIRLGLEKLSARYSLSGCVFCPSDQPLLGTDSIGALLKTFSQNPDKICRLCYEGKAASPVIFGKQFFPELLSLPQGAGGSFLAKKYPAQVILVPARDAFELYDIDTPEDLMALSAHCL